MESIKRYVSIIKMKNENCNPQVGFSLDFKLCGEKKLTSVKFDFETVFINILS